MECQLEFYLLPYVNNFSTVKFWYAGVAFYHDNSMFSGLVASVIEPVVNSQASGAVAPIANLAINPTQILQQATGDPNAKVTVISAYLLPGNQVNLENEEEVAGSTTSDVTLVLEMIPIIP